MTVTDDPSTAVARRPVGELVLYGPLDAADTLVYGAQSVVVGALAFIYQDWLPWVRDDAHTERLDKADRIAGAAGGRLSLREREAWRERRDRRMRRTWQAVSLCVLLAVATCVSGFAPWPSIGYGLAVTAVMVVLALVVDSKEASRWLLRLCVLPCVCSVPFGITTWRWWPAAVLCVLAVAVCVWRGLNVTPPARRDGGGPKLTRRDWATLWASASGVLAERGKELERTGDAHPISADGTELGAGFGARCADPVSPDDVRALERNLGFPVGSSAWVPNPKAAGTGELRLLWADPLPPKAMPRREPMSLSYTRPFEVARRTGGRVTSLSLNRTRMLFAGNSGCIAPWTRIYLPDRDEHVRVDDLAAAGEAVTVQAWDPSRGWVRAQTHGPPYVKGTAALYEVRCSDGATMTVTGQHRFLTPTGWRRLDSLRAGQLLAAPARAGGQGASGYPSGSCVGAPRSTGTGAGCPGGCSMCRRHDGRSPRPASGIGRAGLPSRRGGRTRGRPIVSPEDAPASARSRSRACRRDSPVAGCSVTGAQPGCGSARPVPEAVGTATSTPRPALLRWGGAPSPAGTARRLARGWWGPASVQSLLVSSRSFFSLATPAWRTADSRPSESLRSASQLPCRATTPQCAGGTHLLLTSTTSFPSAPLDGTRWLRIESVTPAGKGVYYDLTVPGPECYVAEGLLNHNSGKSQALQDVLDAVCDMPDATWSAIDRQEGPTFKAYRNQWNRTGTFHESDDALGEIKRLRALCKQRNRRLDEGMDADLDGEVDQWWIVDESGETPDRRGHVLFIDELSSATTDKEFAENLTLLLEVCRKSSVSVVMASPDLDTNRVPRAVLDQVNVTVGFACPFSDAVQMFGKGSTQSGWEPYSLVTATDDEPNDAGKAFIRGGGYNLPELHRFGAMDREEIVARNRARRLWRERMGMSADVTPDDVEDAEIVSDEEMAIRAALELCGDRAGLPVAEAKKSLTDAQIASVRSVAPSRPTHDPGARQSVRAYRREDLVSALEAFDEA